MEQIIEFLTTNTMLVGLLVGAITPPITALVQQPTLPRKLRITIALAVSVILGAALAVSTGQTDPADLAGTIAAVVAASEAVYHKLWKGTAKKIEAATSRGNLVDEPPME